MKIHSYILTYNREELLKLTNESFTDYGLTPIILNDGSNYNINLPNVRTHIHRGKEEFYKTWVEIFEECKEVEADIYLFAPDDFINIDFKRIEEIAKSFDKPYVYNLINDGRNGMWTGIQPYNVNEDTIMCGMVDCGFFCNREALEAINFTFDKPIANQYSSGVGSALSNAFLRSRVVMYKPVSSLAWHGNHDSVMHYEERKRNPLISK